MKLALSILASALGYSAAAGSNPFAPKTTANTAKAQLNAKLMRGATPLRKLQDEAAEEEQVWELDLSTYSIKFEKCQFVKQYAYNGQNGNNKNNKNAQDILTVKHFVVFRLCPDNSCGTCNYKYGEYIIDMESYLAATLQYKQEAQQKYCESCNQCIEMAANAANGGDANQDEAWKCTGIDTSTCYTECQNIENMEANGYVDASAYTQCVKLNSVDANGNNYYAGAVCRSSGSSSSGSEKSGIKIGVFTDQYCTYYDDSVDIASVLKNDDGTSINLSYHLLKETFEDGVCIASCLKEQENNNNNNNGEAAAAEVNELCGQLYETSGKCESTHGFADGMKTYDDYDNQMLNEELVCNFITAVKSGTYDMTGEIVVTGGRAVIGGGTTTTGFQKFSLTFFVLGSVALAGYAAMMHSQLTKGAKAELSRQGGAMA
ncbi:hypothetical protein ACHAXA_001182 [Cyclostephanos tholiformis]|uniref:Uncharacterized protein n=1 Tax=Cyclostephanos tholiformis TaxID=382380 RepID=A0ABD3RCQ9_9STRA